MARILDDGGGIVYQDLAIERVRGQRGRHRRADEQSFQHGCITVFCEVVSQAAGRGRRMEVHEIPETFGGQLYAC